MTNWVAGSRRCMLHQSISSEAEVQSLNSVAAGVQVYDLPELREQVVIIIII